MLELAAKIPRKLDGGITVGNNMVFFMHSMYCQSLCGLWSQQSFQDRLNKAAACTVITWVIMTLNSRSHNVI